MNPALLALLQQQQLTPQTPPSAEAWSAFLRTVDARLAPQQREGWQQRVLGSVPNPVWLCDPQGIVLFDNISSQLEFGPQQGHDIAELIPSDLEQLRLRLLFTQVLQGEVMPAVEMELRPLEGPARLYRCGLTPFGSGPGRFEQIIISCTPLAASSFSNLLNRTEFYESVLNSIPAPLVIFDSEHRYMFCNPVAIQDPELRQWIIGKTDSEYVAYRGLDPEISRRRMHHFLKAVEQRESVSFIETFHAGTPREVQQARTYTPILDENGELLYCIGHGMNITELKKTQQALEELNQELEMRVQARTQELELANDRIQHDALHDALTGLPNRALFHDRLQQAISRLHQEDGQGHFAALMLDVDRFKGVNDTLGHQAGDELLIELSTRLRSVLRASDTVARLGGDEFALLLEPLYSDLAQRQEQVSLIARRIQEVCKEPFKVQNFDASVSVSVGIVLSELGYTDGASVLQDADIAMYHAKEAGRAGHQLFTAQMREKIVHLNLLENELRRAVSRQELRVVYQPIIALESGELNGFEALVRWQHPQRGLLSPAAFMSVAEETGLVLDLDRFVLREACVRVRQWCDCVPEGRPLTLSVNFSGRHFSMPDVLPYLRQVLDETGFDPTLLHLEITEGVLLSQGQVIDETLEYIRGLGIQLHLDDFGTGYSSLSYLHAYPLDTLKIDRAFVRGMLHSEKSAELVRTIIAMAKNMKLQVVAEGIEELEQLDILRNLGCQLGQGYYFAQPLNTEEAWGFIQKALPQRPQAVSSGELSRLS